jgi:hypothetical protein
VLFADYSFCYLWGERRAVRPTCHRMTRRAIELIAAALFVLVASLVVATVVYVVLPANRISGADALYLQTTLGMPKADVLRLMEPYDRARLPSPTEGFQRIWWDERWDGLEIPDPRVASLEAYSFDTFYLPVTFVFTFGADDKLNGRHRYD